MGPIQEGVTPSRTLFINGKFFLPANNGQGRHDLSLGCMLVDNGIIEHVGPDSQDTIAQVAKYAVIQDLNHRIVLPGLIDGHLHLLLLGQSLQKLSLEGCTSLDEIRTRIKNYAQMNPSKPRILCRGWMRFMTEGKALASMLDDLDNRPIFIDSRDLHSTWCNSAAIKELGVESMADPAGGKIHRDESGKASGLLTEAAVLTLIWPHIAKVASLTERVSAIKAAIQAYSEAGYTGMVDMAMEENAWEALLVLRAQERVPMRISAYWLITPSDDEKSRLAQVDRAVSLNKAFNSETSPDLRIVGIKIICDGVIDGCTAHLCEPYTTGAPSPNPIWSADMLNPVIRRAEEAGLQCALHAIGDGAVKLAVDALEKCVPGRRHRIEHLEIVSPEDAKRLGALGITASIQPVHADPAILRAWPLLLGEDRLARAFAYREFLDGGATLALGSDAPTAPYAPMRNIYTATTRRSAREPESEVAINRQFALSLCESVSAATTGSAYSCWADRRTGSLRKGLLADFAALDMEWDPTQLLEARVEETWFAGEQVFISQR